MRAWNFQLCVFVFSSVASLAHDWNALSYHVHSESQLKTAMRLLSSYQFETSASLLDVGCGDGKITKLIADQLSGPVVGLDISPQMISFAEEHFADPTAQLSFVVGDAAHLHFDNQFDYVTSFTALQWVRDQASALKGIYAALKPNGQVLITMPRHYPECLSNAILDVTTSPTYAKRFSGFEASQVFFGLDEYRQMLAEAGFSSISVAEVDGTNLFEGIPHFQNFVKQWLPWAQAFTDLDEKEVFMNQLMARYVAYCPVKEDGSVVFHKKHLEAFAKKPGFERDEL